MNNPQRQRSPLQQHARELRQADQLVRWQIRGRADADAGRARIPPSLTGRAMDQVQRQAATEAWLAGYDERAPR
jgi:hypothetical protein